MAAEHCSGTGGLPAFDPQTPLAIADPYRALAAYQEQDPIHWSDPLRAWAVTGYEDVRQGLRDPRLSADRIRPFIRQTDGDLAKTVKPLGDNLSLWAVFNDPPDHTRLRGLMNKAFTSRAVERLRPKIAELVTLLLDQVDATVARNAADGFDFLQEFAYPLPAYVIADMLGVPRRDVDLLKKWSDDLAKFVLTSRADPEKYTRAAAGMVEMTAYFRDFVADHDPATQQDVTSDLIAARDAGDRLTADELVASCVLLLFAGHETTTQLIANGLRALIEFPPQMADLRANLDDAALVQNAVEEMLRFDGPALSSVRVAAEDFDWHGKAITRGDRVFLFQCSANRDPAMFADPHDFDIRRATAKQNIGFGFGIHFCVGAPLARLEAAIAFPLILQRYSDIRLAEAAPPWSDSILTRGMVRMPVRVTGAGSNRS